MLGVHESTSSNEITNSVDNNKSNRLRLQTFEFAVLNARSLIPKLDSMLEYFSEFELSYLRHGCQTVRPTIKRYLTSSSDTESDVFTNIGDLIEAALLSSSISPECNLRNSL